MSAAQCHPSRVAQRRARDLAVAAALLLSACAAPDVKHSVSWPLQAPLPERRVAVAAPLVTARETTPEVLELNRGWMKLAAQELDAAVKASGLEQDPAAPLTIASRIHVAYEKTKFKSAQGTKWQPGFVDVQLELKDTASGAVRYSTFSKTALKASLLARWFGWGQTNEEFIAQTVSEAIRQFGERLASPPATTSPAAPAADAPAPMPPGEAPKP